MKLEIEITEQEIKDAVERKVRVAVADQTNQWGADRKITDRVKELWPIVVDELIIEILRDLPTLKAKVVAMVERKLQGQVTALMKVKK